MSASRLSCMDGASDDNALGLSALSARGAVFTDDSAGDANVSRQRLTRDARSSSGLRVRGDGPLDGGSPVGVEQRSKRKPCVQLPRRWRGEATYLCRREARRCGAGDSC